MARPAELFWAHSGHSGEPIEREIPSQSVSPFVKQGLDGLCFGHLVIEPDHERLWPLGAFSKGGRGHPARSDHHGLGWR